MAYRRVCLAAVRQWQSQKTRSTAVTGSENARQWQSQKTRGTAVRGRENARQWQSQQSETMRGRAVTDIESQHSPTGVLLD